jgi:Protein of unknown function (DUF3187)
MQVAEERPETGAAKAPSLAVFMAGAFLFLMGASDGVRAQDSRMQSESRAERSQWLGLFRVRDLTPFGLTRLDFLPAHSVNEPPNTFAVELSVSYQNTWARSKNVAWYLKSRGDSRMPVTSADIDAITTLGGDAYLVDGEYGLLDLTLHYRASTHFGTYLTVPYLFFSGGNLDSTIESFHGALGFGDSRRKLVPRNQWMMIAKLQNKTIVQTSPPSDAFGDPVLGVRYSLFDKPQSWNLILESAVKIPRGNEQFMISTGDADYGLQASYQRFFDRNALYATLALVYYNAPDIEIARDEWIPTVILGWETRMSGHTGFVLQFYGSRSTVQETTLPELSANKYQVTSGVQWNFRGNFVRFGLTENIGNFNNTPDVGLTLSFGRIYAGHER